MSKSVIGAIMAAAMLKTRGAPIESILPEYIELQETEAAYDAADEALHYALEDPQKEDGLSGYLVEIGETHERQGFINGFRYGYQLAKELVSIEVKGASSNE